MVAHSERTFLARVLARRHICSRVSDCALGEGWSRRAERRKVRLDGDGHGGGGAGRREYVKVDINF